MNRRSFVIFTEWKDLIFGLSEEEQLILFRRLFDVHTGEEIEQTSFSNLEFVWSFISKKLEENNDAWERKREGNSRGGKVAQERKKAASNQPKSTQVNSSQPKSTQVNSLVNVNVNANVNANANVNENANGELISLSELNSKEKDMSDDISKEKGELSLIPIPDSKPKKERKRFIPPTVEEVAAYCRERGNNIDAEAFVAHYTMRNWIPRGYTKQMTNWKMAVITWEKREQKFAQEQRNNNRVVGGNEFTALKEQEGYTGSNIFGG